MRRMALMVAVAVAAAVGSASGETVVCKTTRDVWLSAHADEIHFNMGAADRIKLKAHEEYGILDFDVSALRGKTVTEAWLYVKPVGEARVGALAKSDLRYLTVATVGHDWVEGKSARYAKDVAGAGATFAESSHGKANWGWDGATVGDVTFGNGNSLRHDAIAQEDDGWLKVPLDVRLIGAMVAGATHGLVLQDGNGVVTKVNAFIASRESETPPYLKVVTGAADTAAPAAPADVKVAAAPRLATDKLGAIEVSLKVPADALAYAVSVNGKAVDRWQVPFAAAPGTVQTFPLLDLPAGGAVTVEVTALDAAGNASPPVAAKGTVSDVLKVPALPPGDFKPAGGEPKALGAAKVWAFPEVTKVDPVSAKVLHEQAAEEFRKANPVWDGASGTIRLAAARGEIVSFQLALEGAVQGCRVAVSALKGPGEIPDKGVRLWRNWYAGTQSEYALPLKDTVDCPMADNKITGQTLQAVTVDYHIPPATAPGEYAGTVTVSAGQEKVELPLKVKVYSATIPDEVFFNPELNCYGGPGTATSEKFKSSFKLAHYHRCTINRVPYSQRQPGSSGDWAPKLDAEGRIADWTTFEKGMGPLLDGSLFADNPRAGVPVPTLYLPLHIGWPVDYKKYYHPGEGLTTPFNNDYMRKLRHDLLGKPLEEAMDGAFGKAFAAAAGDFARHATEKGWKRTQFQMYLNQKWDWGYAAWTLDEPVTSLDFLALRYFGRLFNEGVGDGELFTAAFQEALFTQGLAKMNRPRATLLVRTDISRPMVQGSVHDGVVSMMYVNSGQFAFPRLMRGHKLRAPTQLYCYGACNAIDRSNWESAAWCLKAYVHHCDGVLPWDSLTGDLLHPHANGLIIDDSKGMKYGEALASFRVHALRRGAQDAELLRLLQLKNGWSREQVGMLVAQKVPLGGAFKQGFADEAAALKFGNLTSEGFCQLKEGVLKLLEP